MFYIVCHFLANGSTTFKLYMMNVEIKRPRRYLNVNRYHDYNQTLVYEEQRFRTFTKLVFFKKNMHEKWTNIE